jgi:hypothetical protein
MVRPRVETEVTNSGETKRHAAIGKFVIALVGGGGGITALLGFGGNYLHESQKEQVEIQQINRAAEFDELKRELRRQQKEELENARRTIEEAVNRGEGGNSAGTSDSRLLRGRSQRSTR